MGEETEPADRIVVKIPLLQIDPDLSFEAVIQYLPTEHHQALPIPPALLKTLGDHAQKSGAPKPSPLIASLKRVFVPNLWVPEARAAPLDGVFLGSAGSGQSAQLLPVTSFNNFDDPGRLNIVVVGFDMQPEDSRTLFQDIRNELLAREPVFQQNPAFANWWVLAKTYPAPNETCSTKGFQLPEEDLLTDNLTHTMFVYMFPNLKCGNAGVRVAQQLGKSMRIGTKKMQTWPLRVFAHEFGHAFGGLIDEYEKTDGPDKPKWPNCAASQQEGKQWWEALYPTMQLHAGCRFRPDNWRFFENSIMRNNALDPIMFGNIHRLMLCEAVFVVTGATKGSYCMSLMGTAQGQYENSTAQCTDGADNDGDGFVDCKDANCDGIIACPDENTALLCSDGKDNDGDGRTDWEDEDCLALGGAASVAENTYAKCSNTFDDDGDGLLDCADPDCANVASDIGQSCEFGKELSCGDKIDNDGDSQYAHHYIGIALQTLAEGLWYAAYADKFDTQQVEWPYQVGQSKIMTYDEKKDALLAAYQGAFWWCKEWYGGMYPDVPFKANKVINENVPIKCSQNGCFTYAEQLQSIFALEELGDGTPNIFYQQQDQYEVFIFQCAYTLVDQTDCKDPDCFVACGKNP